MRNALDYLDDGDSKPNKKASKNYLKFAAVLAPAIFGAIGSYWQARNEAQADAQAAYSALKIRQDQVVESIAALREEILRQRIRDLEISKMAAKPKTRRRTRRRAAAPIKTKILQQPDLKMPIMRKLPKNLAAARDVYQDSKK